MLSSGKQRDNLKMWSLTNVGHEQGVVVAGVSVRAAEKIHLLFRNGYEKTNGVVVIVVFVVGNDTAVDIVDISIHSRIISALDVSSMVTSQGVKTKEGDGREKVYTVAIISYRGSRSIRLHSTR